MSERTLIERLNAPWPEHETEEVTLPAWVIELCAEGATRIAALEAQLAELAAENERLKQEIAATQEKLIRANDELIQRNSKALSRTGGVKPLDLSNLLRHAFISGFKANGGDVDVAAMEWTEYDPNVCAAYSRILSALEPAEPAPETAEAERIANEVPEDLTADKPEQSGWKLVPVEPTEEMCRALLNVDGWSVARAFKSYNWAGTFWKAMLAASPTPPTAGGGDVE